MVHRGQLRTVLRGKTLMLRLVRRRLEVVLIGRLHLGRRGMGLDPASAVIGDVVRIHDGVSVDDLAVLVDVGHMDAAKARHCTVIGKNSTAPLTTEEADSTVAESVIDSAIEPDVRAPVACVPSIDAAAESPVARGPQKANPGRRNPDTRNPVVACITIGPVARGPDIPRSG